MGIYFKAKILFFFFNKFPLIVKLLTSFKFIAQMDHFFTIPHAFIDTKQLFIIFTVLVSIAFCFFWSLKKSVDLKNEKIKKYIKLNYAIPEDELSLEEKCLIRLTFDNTIKNRKIVKMAVGDAKKKTRRSLDKKVSFEL